MTTILIRVVLAAVFTLSALVAGAKANTEVYDKVVVSTGIIGVKRADGKPSVGTCWVVDHERKLVITNNHVVGDINDAKIAFPTFRDGEVEHVMSDAGKAIGGKVLIRSVARDLALVQLESLPANAKALPLASKSARPGETVHSIGNSGAENGVLWRYTRGQVRLVAQYQIKIETGMINAKVVETQAPINHGDSGGALVNDKGEVVGVISAFNEKQRLVSWSIDVNEVREFLIYANKTEVTSVGQEARR